MADTLFSRYPSIPSFDPNVLSFANGEEIVVTEKLPGKHFRAGWLHRGPRTSWDRVRKFFRRLPEWEFVYGNREEQWRYKRGAEITIYREMVEQYDLLARIPDGMVYYCQLHDDDVTSGVVDGTGRKLALFDVKTAERGFLDWDYVERLARYSGLETVPVLYRGGASNEKIQQVINATADDLVIRSYKARNTRTMVQYTH